MLKAMLVSKDRQHALQTLVGELYYASAALTDEMLVVRLPRHRLIALEALAKVMCPDEPTFEQKLESAVHRGCTDLLALQPQLFSDSLHRQMLVRMKHHPGDEIPLARDWLMVLPEMAAKAF